jgi:hypothetical protein
MQLAGIPPAASKRCEDDGCGDQARVRHHGSYDEPLKVVFLCQRCHSTRHPMERDPERGTFTKPATEQKE